jgi:hypothetical protein
VKISVAFVTFALAFSACTSGEETELETRLSSEQAVNIARRHFAPGVEIVGVRLISQTATAQVGGRRLPSLIRREYSGPIWIVEARVGPRTWPASQRNAWAVIDDGTAEQVLGIVPRWVPSQGAKAAGAI